MQKREESFYLLASEERGNVLEDEMDWDITLMDGLEEEESW